MKTDSPGVSVVVERYSFFQRPGGGLARWTETSPIEAHIHHFECGCTTNAKTRPLGEPKSVQQTVTVSAGDAALSLGTGWLTFKKAGWEDHKYFMFNPSERSMKIEIMLPGYGLVDCFFAHLYYGSSVDTSMLMNGHSPTRLDLSDVAGKHWLHACCLGKEVKRHLSSPAETALLDAAYGLHERIQLTSARYVADLSSPVDVLREHVEADPALLADFLALRDLLGPIAADIRSTEIFKLTSDLDREVDRQIGASRTAKE
jgi:hypothetical protein